MSKKKFEIVIIHNTKLTVDISLIQNDELWFNATQIAKSFSKDVREFVRRTATKDYIGAILNEGNPRIKNLKDLVQVKKGRYGGTWLHKELAFEFAGWCSALFRRKLHTWVEQRLNDEHDRKQVRLAARTGYLPMSEAVQDAHDPVQFYHFSNEANLINRIVLGLSSKEYRETYGVDSVRDAVATDQLKWIEKLQLINTGLIEVGMDFKTRKRLLRERYNDNLRLVV